MDVNKLAKLDILPHRGMSHDDRVAAIKKNLAELRSLATDDGSIAAAWALEAIERYQDLIEAMKESGSWGHD